MVSFEPVRTEWDIVRAAHAELLVTDLEVSRRFYVDLLGFVVTEQAEGALFLRGYEETAHHSLVLRQSDRPAVTHVAFRVAAEPDLELLQAHFAAHDLPSRWVTDEPGQGRGLRLQDGSGFPLEFYHSMTRQPSLLRSFDRYRGAHVMRLDHFNLFVPDVESSFEQFRQLGFRCSEYTSTDGPEQQVWGAWLYRKPAVHDIALTNGDGPRLHHLGFWVADTQSILRACDVLAAAGLSAAIERGPGRHGVSNAFFLYLRDPDGHRIELYTSDYYTGDPDQMPLRWSVSDPRRGTFWGHAAPASWFEEGTLAISLEGNPVELSTARLRDRPPTAT